MPVKEREELWNERIDQWRDSGLSQRAFALREGYPVRQVGYWVRRLTGDQAAAAMLPVVVKQAPAAPALILRGRQGWTIEVPTATPASWLADLLRGL